MKPNPMPFLAAGIFFVVLQIFYLFADGGDKTCIYGAAAGLALAASLSILLGKKT